MPVLEINSVRASRLSEGESAKTPPTWNISPSMEAHSSSGSAAGAVESVAAEAL
jgi:hypothetical protein